MEAHPFQTTVTKHLLNGRSVILQAPTGAGKTRAALMPFIKARLEHEVGSFPHRCVYAVPMRVLANQFEAEYKNLLDTHHAAKGNLDAKPLCVTVQTGERAEDRKFEGDLIFTTIDQLLSNFLAIPFALSNGMANLNAATVFGSYLIFDEFHLFPFERDGSGALGTTIEMLRWLKGITPFVLMTATFSETMLDRLCKLLDAEKVVLSADELTALPAQQKQRYYHTVSAELDADKVLEKRGTRSIAICNTVDRAQKLYHALLNNPASKGITIKLLHSRFLKKDRSAKEKWTQREFGRNIATRQEKSAILVATQVIEVGLDINCENLHTELAPASSILQRGGRCARYEGNSGHVFIYDLPRDDNGNRRTAPYLGLAAAQCDSTWTAFADRDDRTPYSYADEMAIVDAVHSEDDNRLLDMLDASSGGLAARMEGAIAGPNRKEARGAASDLIRDVDNITLVMHPDPNAQTVPEPWLFEGFGIYRGSVLGKLEALGERASALDLERALLTPKAIEDDSENSQKELKYEWRQVISEANLIGQTLLFIHPSLAAYDEEIGFRLVLDDEDVSNNFKSPQIDKTKAPRSQFSYQPETYGKHIGWLYKVYRKSQRDEIAWVARRLDEQLGCPAGLVDRAMRLTLGCHDLGKLTTGWQDWAHDWQHRVGQQVGQNVMLAHTFFDPALQQHQDLDRRYGRNRPPHAVEGAIAAGALVATVLGEDFNDLHISSAVITAIARHHNAGSSSAQNFKLDPQAQNTIRFVLDNLITDIEIDWEYNKELLLFEPTAKQINLTENIGLVPQGDRLGQLLYFLLVRTLRLCDSQGLELSNGR